MLNKELCKICNIKNMKVTEPEKRFEYYWEETNEVFCPAIYGIGKFIPIKALPPFGCLKCLPCNPLSKTKVLSTIGDRIITIHQQEKAAKWLSEQSDEVRNMVAALTLMSIPRAGG